MSASTTPTSWTLETSSCVEHSIFVAGCFFCYRYYLRVSTDPHASCFASYRTSSAGATFILHRSSRSPRDKIGPRSEGSNSTRSQRAGRREQNAVVIVTTYSLRLAARIYAQIDCARPTSHRTPISRNQTEYQGPLTRLGLYNSAVSAGIVPLAAVTGLASRHARGLSTFPSYTARTA